MQETKTTPEQNSGTITGQDSAAAAAQNSGTTADQSGTEEQKASGIKAVIATFRERGLWQASIQFIKFGLIGGLNTVIGWCIVNGCVYLLHWDKQVGNLISNIITIFISFMLNSRFVFDHANEDRKTVTKTMIKVYASYAFTGFVVGGALLVLWKDILGIPVYIATVLNLIVTIPLNFLLNKFWVYRKKK